ncbi:MAG: hypothetical protein AB1758_25885 [Candidatus Eremiobacterota bacterium]
MSSPYLRALSAYSLLLEMLSEETPVAYAILEERLLEQERLLRDAGHAFRFGRWAQGGLRDMLQSLLVSGFVRPDGELPEDAGRAMWRKRAFLLTASGATYRSAVRDRCAATLAPLLEVLDPEPPQERIPTTVP